MTTSASPTPAQQPTGSGIAALFPQPCTALVYTVGKRTGTGSSTVRHIADASDRPLCWSTRHGSAKSFGGGFVRDSGETTCKHCARIAEQQRVAAERTAPPAIAIYIPALNLTGVLVGIVPPRTVGGVTRYRVEWREALLNSAPRQAGFWLEDFDAESRVRLATVLSGVEGEAA